MVKIMFKVALSVSLETLKLISNFDKESINDFRLLCFSLI